MALVKCWMPMVLIFLFPKGLAGENDCKIFMIKIDFYIELDVTV